MKKFILAVHISFLAILLSNCTVTTASAPTTSYTDYNTGYTGYTVNYGYGDGNDYMGEGTYVGYGGWASSFYAPGYRYGYHPR